MDGFYPSVPLQKESGVPLYAQLAEALEKGIREGAYPEGARIPSEKELMEASRVSRVTVRLAMRRLCEKDLIVRRQGLGTFVRRPMFSQAMEDLLGYYPSLLRKGLKPRTKVLEYGLVAPEPEVRENLALPPGARALRLVRQYLLEKDVRVIIQMHIPEALAGNWTKKEAEEKNSFRLLREHAGVRIQSSTVKIRATLAPRALGKLLNLPPESPVLELRRLTCSTEGKPVEFAVLYFPGGAYELTASLQAGDWKDIRVESK